MESTNVADAKSLNHFKLGLYMGKDVVCETIFDADCYNPYVRYSVDIRDHLNDILNNFKRILSKDCDSDLDFEYLDYDFYEYYKKEVEKYDNKVKNYYNFRPTKNIEFKFVLYINENTIVERLFNVSKLKYDSLYSTNIVNFMYYIKDIIKNELRKNDIKMMWEDYDLINRYNLNIQQIRELSDRDRKSMLYKIYNN